MEYPPTSGDRHLTVFLDAGHGGLDPGGVGETETGQTIDEADVTLPVELDTMGLLRAKGFTVVVSRTKDETVARLQPGDVSGGLFTAEGVHDDVAARDVCANMAKANSSSASTSTPGLPFDAGSVTGYDTARPFSAQNLKLATLVQTDVMNAMNAQGWGIPDLGVVDDSELGGPALTTAAADYGHLLLLGPADPASSPRRAGCRARSSSRSSSPTRTRGAWPTARPVRRSLRAAWPRPMEQYFAPAAHHGPELRGAAPADAARAATTPAVEQAG